jgi:hypothetical protein
VLVEFPGLLVVRDVTNWYQSMISTLSLDGLDKWSLDPRFQVEIMSGGTNFEPKNVPECQEVTLAMLRSSEGVAVS